MKPDEFEKQLQRQPLRAVPPAWRKEILAHALGSKKKTPFPSTPAGNPATAWWREWLWPCPEAWAGIAALWLIILGLNATAPTGEHLVAGKPSNSTPTPTPDAGPLLAEQRRELARLLDNPADLPPVRKPVNPPGPRSERSSPSKV